MEKLKPVVGYEGVFEVSDIGNVKSFPRVIVRRDGKKYTVRKEKILTFQVDKDGYHRVELNHQGVPIKPYAHRLAAQAFHPNPLNKEQVNHINGIKNDNRIENLEWVTKQENREHAMANGLVPDQWGLKNPINKLTEEQVFSIRRLKNNGMKPAEISRTIGIPHSNVRNVYYGYTWTRLIGGDD